MSRVDRDTSAYLDTPRGIVTAAGTTFHTTEALLKEYASDVLDYRDTSQLIEDAEVWLGSAATATIWIFPLFLLAVPVWAALLLGILFFCTWSVFAPSAPFLSVLRLFSILEKPVLLAVYYVIAMTLFGWNGQTAAAVVGLGVFVGLRLRLLQLLLHPLIKNISGRLYSLPLPDQVLRAIVVRTALKHRINLAELDHLETSARKAWARK